MRKFRFLHGEKLLAFYSTCNSVVLCVFDVTVQVRLSESQRQRHRQKLDAFPWKAHRDIDTNAPCVKLCSHFVQTWHAMSARSMVILTEC